jgi:transcriptional regulator with XRE-family HTH domain
MDFNENLKGELEYRGMPVKELAYKTGIPKKTIDKYLLSNGSMPPADKAVLIARILDVTVEYLVTGKNDYTNKLPNDFMSPEMRSIKNYVEPLSRENRKVIETAVNELSNLLKKPINNKPVTFTPLQRVFLQLFRK